MNIELMTDEEFRLLRDFVSQQCGIFYNEKQKYIFQQKLLKRLEKNALKNFKEYYYLLKYGFSKEELQQLYNVLTVNETYFFREKEHLLALKDDILPELFKAKPNKNAKILSAGCSTGEEPFSISMIIHEHFKSPVQNINITGIDISQKALETAQSGNYRKISLTFRAIEQKYLNKYFEKSEDNYHLKEEIRNIVKFKLVNLLDFNTLITFDKNDVIFCRNVMIYFNKKFKQDLVLHYYKMLNPGGFLILSNTENLNDIESDFVLTKRGNVFMYQKQV